MTTATAEPITITLPPLHPSQQAIAKDPTRFKVVCCGRRWGKTLLAMTVLLRDALKGKRLWHVAPSYKQTLEGWDYLQRLVAQMPKGIAKVQLSELLVTFVGGGSIQMRTADNPNNLRGAGLDGVVLDEAADIKPEAWDLVLRPALADKQGWAMFIGTPRHFNWFFTLFERGQDPNMPDWASWQKPTWDNPFIEELEITAAQKEMLEEDFNQEFGAEFTAVGGAIFRLLNANRPFYLRPMPKDVEFIKRGVGMDWGTTPEHQAAVISAGKTKQGAVWITSGWLDHSGSSDKWRDEAIRCKRDHGATFARVDRSQSSELDRLIAVGLQADKGNPNVEQRIGEVQSLILGKSLFFDINGPGVREAFEHFCNYHRFPASHPRAGQVDETEDDDVDAGCYVVSELTKQQNAMPTSARMANSRGQMLGGRNQATGWRNV